MHWLTLLTTGVTAFIGSGIGTAVVTHWLTGKRAREELLRDKLEELFLAVSGYGLQVFASTHPYFGAMEGKYSYDAANDLSMKDADRDARYHEKTQMLVNLYFPEHRELLEKLLSTVYKATDIRKSFRDNYAIVQVSPQAAKQLADTLTEFDEIEKFLLLMLSGTSANLLRPPSLWQKLKQRFGQKRRFMDFMNTINTGGKSEPQLSVADP